MHSSVAALFSAGGRIPATPGNANCAEVKGGRGRFAKRRTTGPRWNGRDCLNAATVLTAVSGLAMNRTGFAREPANSDGPVDFVLEAHFRLNADIAPCSFRAPR